MRTDQILARNVDELQALQRGRRLRRAGYVLLAIVLLGVAGAAAYLACFPDARRALAARVGQWVQRKGRALMGRTWLTPFLAVLERSDLTEQEKKEWRSFADTTWDFAETVGGDVLRKEDVIDLGRKAVESRSGLYYGLLRIEDAGFDRTEFDSLRKHMGERLLRQTVEALQQGRYSDSQLDGIRDVIHLALVEVCSAPESATAGEKKKDEKTGESDPQLRRLLGALHDLEKTGKFTGDGNPVDMAAEFRKEMEGFRAGVEAVKRGVGNGKQGGVSSRLSRALS